MRASVFISTIFAASVLAAPLAAEPAKRDANPTDLGLPVDLTGLVGDIDLDKRQLGLDLTPVTDLVGDLLTTVAGLLPELESELSEVESLITGLLDLDVSGLDVESTLALVTSTINDILVQLGGLDLGDLGSLTKRQDISLDLSSLINQVTGLLTSVIDLTATLDVGSLVDLVEELLNTLTGLTSILGLKKI